MEPQALETNDGRNLCIREADPSDAAAVIGYVESVCGETDFLCFGVGEFGMTVAEEKEFLYRSRDADTSLYLLAIVDGNIAGTLNFSPGARPRLFHTGELGMSVRKSHWGLGIGAALLETLIVWAKQSSVLAKLNLRVRTDNERAIRLYERKGFRVEGSISKAIFLNGKFYDHLWMGRDV